MLKQLLFIVIISAVAVFFAAELYGALHYLGAVQNLLIKTFIKWLPLSKSTILFSRVIVIVILPLLISYILAFIYWLIKRDELPYLKQIISVLWIISLLIFIFYK